MCWPGPSPATTRVRPSCRGERGPEHAVDPSPARRAPRHARCPRGGPAGGRHAAAAGLGRTGGGGEPAEQVVPPRRQHAPELQRPDADGPALRGDGRRPIPRLLRGDPGHPVRDRAPAHPVRQLVLGPGARRGEGVRALRRAPVPRRRDAGRPLHRGRVQRPDRVPAGLGQPRPPGARGHGPRCGPDRSWRRQHLRRRHRARVPAAGRHVLPLREGRDHERHRGLRRPRRDPHGRRRGARPIDQPHALHHPDRHPRRHRARRRRRHGPRQQGAPPPARRAGRRHPAGDQGGLRTTGSDTWCVRAGSAGVGVQHHGGRHPVGREPARAGGAGGGAGPGRRRGGQPGQVDVRRRHEPRDPHAHDWRHRHAGGPGPDRPEPGPGQHGRHGPGLGQRAAADHRRHPGLLQDRGRQAGAGTAGVHGAPPGGVRGPDLLPHRIRQGDPPDLHGGRAGGAGPCRRCPPPPPDPQQLHLQRGEVHLLGQHRPHRASRDRRRADPVPRALGGRHCSRSSSRPMPRLRRSQEGPVSGW
jgi:hypothetical protein